MRSSRLFAPAQLGNLTLSNHIVMAPMTRSRATALHVPTDEIATYYAQRASAGLLITEGASPSPNGEGYARIPGIWNEAQIKGWRKVTDAVHAKGGKIFIQLMHTGRIGHALNLTNGGEVLAPSAVKAEGAIYTDQEGMKDHPVPRAMTTEEVQDAVQEFVQAAINAVTAGFDGVEIHGANGYLIEQFIRPTTNQRTDQYGGTTENYARFALEIAERTAAAIGKDKTGIRLSPYGVASDMPYQPEFDSIYAYLAEKLGDYVTYVHLVDHSALGAPAVPDSIKQLFRETYTGTLILSGGYTKETAEADLESGKADLIAIGRPFISNPDLVERLQQGAALSDPDPDTFYTPGEKGYTDYPVLEETIA
ncbi:MAG: alkene reductase [Siphonobacter aquaeclarae]|jgi:N-ethylmaleimide reductase|nr:alkene reductase [Siphonobacter aquaeclarae]